MSYYDPYYTPRSRRPSLSYAGTSYEPVMVSLYPLFLYLPLTVPTGLFSTRLFSTCLLCVCRQQPEQSSSPSYMCDFPPSIRTRSQCYEDSDYDDMAIHDPYYSERRRSISGYPPLVQSMPITRPRRSSSVSYTSSPSYIDPLRRGFGRVLKFKRKGAFRAGITVGEAQANVRLSGLDSFTFQDLGVDARGKIYVTLRVSHSDM